MATEVQKFADSAEAEAHMAQIGRLLADPRLAHYCATTDRNFGCRLLPMLMEMQKDMFCMEQTVQECV